MSIISSGINAYEEPRHVVCGRDVEKPMLNDELVAVIERVVHYPEARDLNLLKMRLRTAAEQPVAFTCPFAADVDVDFDSAGHGYWTCPYCGGLNEHEDDES